MKYHLSGSDVAADVVYPSPVCASKTEPIEIGIVDPGPSHAAIAELSDIESTPLLLADRYRLLRRLGSGGMGAVYLAEQLDSHRRRVAIKILDASARDWCRAIDRFLWEARLCARIHHPNVVEAFDYGSTPGGVVFMVMELLEGRDLRALVRERGALSWTWTRYVMRQVCAGINALHRVGVVHRDLKPGNCFYVRRNGTIKIIDLGIATFEDPMAAAPGIDDRTIVGTPEYMAPEQIRGSPVDRRADVYAAGVMIYELLTGRVPYRGRCTEEVFERHLNCPPPPIAEHAPMIPAPDRIDDVLRKALAKRPRDRYANMLELSDALEQLGNVAAARRGGSGVAPLRRLDALDDAPTLRRRRAR